MNCNSTAFLVPMKNAQPPKTISPRKTPFFHRAFHFCYYAPKMLPMCSPGVKEMFRLRVSTSKGLPYTFRVDSYNVD